MTHSGQVSIPFIAGQWSLRGPRRRLLLSGGAFQSPSLRGSGRFFSLCDPEYWVTSGFQSPSLRGSGRFPPARGGHHEPSDRFNPLHCGAVVASKSDRPPPHGGGASFNPLHCGAVVASWSSALRAQRRHAPFQSPSLRGSGRFKSGAPTRGGCSSCLNPLHCGAVVASRRWSAAPRSPYGLNPLHCGAVVASAFAPFGAAAEELVSIPFIAGQWSLRVPPHGGRGQRRKSQSPSLRGSGRFRPRRCSRR